MSIEVTATVDDGYGSEDEFPTNMTDEQFGDFIEQCLSREIEEQSRIENAATASTRFMCCGEEMRMGNDNSLLCVTCSRIRNFIGDLDIVHASAEISRIHVFGKNASLHRRKVFGFSSSSYNYARSRERALAVLLDRMQSNSKTLKFSKSVLVCARDICLEVTAMRIFRKDILLEIIAASLDEACASHGQMRRENEIAQYVGLKVAGYSHAKKILRQLHSNGSIKLPERVEDEVTLTVRDFLRRLVLSQDYVPLVVAVVNKITDDSMTNAILASKCAAVIWILVRVLTENETIPNCVKSTMVDLEREFSIRQMTIVNTSTTIMNFWSRVRITFAEHGIDLPKELSVRAIRKKMSKKVAAKK